MRLRAETVIRKRVAKPIHKNAIFWRTLKLWKYTGVEDDELGIIPKYYKKFEEENWIFFIWPSSSHASLECPHKKFSTSGLAAWPAIGNIYTDVLFYYMDTLPITLAWPKN